MSEGTTFFGQWLRQRRRSLDLTQTGLARAIGCSVVTIRKLEIGERRPSREMVGLLANRLGIAEDERAAFARFARTDQGADMFRHPLFVEPGESTPILKSDELITPQTFFPIDTPGLLDLTPNETLQVPTNKLVVGRFHHAPIDSPRRATLPDGRWLCKFWAAGRIVGAINGTMQQEITQLIKAPDQPDSNFAHLAILFSIETDVGSIRGGCAGFEVRGSNGSSDYVRLHGKIYSVTDSYADLFLTDVYYESEVVLAPTRGIKDQGVLIIVPS
jgi:transcriptional regulator with XRE-family HTH domain